jgi:hypothetical protein
MPTFWRNIQFPSSGLMVEGKAKEMGQSVKRNKGENVSIVL